MKLAHESNWMRIEQRTEPDPLEMVAYGLYGSPANTNNHTKQEEDNTIYHVASSSSRPDPAIHKYAIIDDELAMLEGDSGAV